MTGRQMGRRMGSDLYTCSSKININARSKYKHVLGLSDIYQIIRNAQLFHVSLYFNNYRAVR